MLNLDLQKEALTRAFCKLTNIIQGKEIKEKHINCIRAILRLVTHDGNYLKGSWKMVLELISKIDYYHMTVSGSKSELDAFFTEVRNKKKLQQANNPNIEKEILTEKNNMDKIGKEINQDDYEIIFSKTINIDDENLIDFVTSLCELSKEELASKDAPRIFSLQKLVEVAELNIRRLRITWSQIWGIISEHLTQVGSNPSPNIAEKAIDSLRQLAKKLLLKDEISVYKFQMEFLKPFENILVNNINTYRTKEYVLTCITNLVLEEAASIKSGWRIIFNIFSLASDDDTEQGLNRKTFDTIIKVFNSHFSQIKDNYTEFAHCVKKYSYNYPEECINIYKNSYELLDDLQHVTSLLLCLGSLVRDERENIRNISCSAFFHIIKRITDTTINDSVENETNHSFNTGKHLEFSVTETSQAKSFRNNTVSSITFNTAMVNRSDEINSIGESNEGVNERSFNPGFSQGENTNEFGSRPTIKIDYTNFPQKGNNVNFVNLANSAGNTFGNFNNDFYNNSTNNNINNHNVSCKNLCDVFALPKITYDSEYWKNLFKNIFKPIIDDLIGIKLSDTLEVFLIDLNEILMGAYDKIDFLLESYLEVFTYIISSDNESTALAGFDAFKIFIEKLSQNPSKRINEKFWEKIVKTISQIFSKTRQQDLLNLDIKNFDDPSYQAIYQDIVYRNIIFCIIQDNLIKLSDEIIENHYEKLNFEQLNILMECLGESWELAYNFNIEFNLRQLIHYHFMSDLENVAALFKQQQEGTFIFFKALNKNFDSNKFTNDEIKANSRVKILANSKKILKQFIERVNYNEDQTYLYNENERLLTNMAPVIIECVFKSLEKVEFLKEENDRNEFTQLLIELITCSNLEIRMKVKELLTEIFKNYNNNINNSNTNSCDSNQNKNGNKN